MDACHNRHTHTEHQCKARRDQKQWRDNIDGCQRIASHSLSDEYTVCNSKEGCKHHRQQRRIEDAVKQWFNPRLSKVYTVSFLVFDLFSHNYLFCHIGCDTLCYVVLEVLFLGVVLVYIFISFTFCKDKQFFPNRQILKASNFTFCLFCNKNCIFCYSIHAFSA